jgi:hypothetical protein
MQPTRRAATRAPGRDHGADTEQAEYFLLMMATRWQELETEIAERCNELRGIPLSARKSERARNIRRLIRVKQNEVPKVKELCAALAERMDSR